MFRPLLHETLPLSPFHSSLYSLILLLLLFSPLPILISLILLFLLTQLFPFPLSLSISDFSLRQTRDGRNPLCLNLVECPESSLDSGCSCRHSFRL